MSKASIECDIAAVEAVGVHAHRDRFVLLSTHTALEVAVVQVGQFRPHWLVVNDQPIGLFVLARFAKGYQSSGQIR